jgi:hypothetical protein
MSQTEPEATHRGRPPMLEKFRHTTIHHMLRNLVAMPDPNDRGQVSAEQADALVEGWFAKGFNLFGTHLVGTSHGGPIILWIFIK